MLESESSLTQEFINTINLRILEVETFNILKLLLHEQEYGRYTVITEQLIHRTSSSLSSSSSYFKLLDSKCFCSPS